MGLGLQEEVPLGQAEVRAVFGSGSGRVAGCMVNEGKLVKGCGVKVMRGGNAVHTGKLDSLKRVKELAKEVSLLLNPRNCHLKPK
jgi:translation initiation factor IF-2